MLCFHQKFTFETLRYRQLSTRGNKFAKVDNSIPTGQNLKFLENVFHEKRILKEF